MGMARQATMVVESPFTMKTEERVKNLCFKFAMSDFHATSHGTAYEW